MKAFYHVNVTIAPSCGLPNITLLIFT